MNTNERFKRLKKEVSRKASLANKRLRRLEDRGLTSSPAYQAWLKAKGGENFGVRGKDYNALQSELAKLNNFIDYRTSTVNGSKNLFREIAENTGLEYDPDLIDMNEQAKVFFDLASKTEQYLRTTEGSASARGYQQIWEAVAEYVSEGTTGTDYDITQVVDILNAKDDPVNIIFKGNWFRK